jgi:hypothetical protein
MSHFDAFIAASGCRIVDDGPTGGQARNELEDAEKKFSDIDLEPRSFDRLEYAPTSFDVEQANLEYGRRSVNVRSLATN